MRTIIAKLESISPYSQSRMYEVPKLPEELDKDFEARTWRNRLHRDEKGFVFIPPMAFKNCLSEIAKFRSIQIPGKGKSTYTKHFEAGILVIDPLRLDISAEEVQGEWLSVPSDGRRGGSRRVNKCFPVIQHWSGTQTFLILDDIITLPVFKQHLEEAGKFIGIGRFRPRNNGFYGRFKVNEVTEV